MLDYLFFIGVVSIIYGFVWKWIVLIPYSVLTGLVFRFNENVTNFFDLIIRSFGYYIMVSIVSIGTFGISTVLSFNYTIICAIIGFVFLFTNFFGSMSEKSKYIEQSSDSHSESFFFIELIISFIAVIFYIVSLFVPSLVFNNLTIFVCSVIVWIQNLKYIGTIIEIFGTLFVGYTILSGFFISFVILYGMFTIASDKIKGKLSA